jgi:hypothetical protein
VPEPPSLPAELRDRYTVDGELGRGAFGVVLRARDRELDRAVAIKLLATQGGAELKDRFDREAALMAALEHPGVVRLYDFGHTADGPYLVMELLEGRTLAEDSNPDLLAVARDVGAALEAIHAAGIIHRDVKPANVLRTDDGRTVLLDLGLARNPQQSTMTRTGALVGTPTYLAPELWRGEAASPAADWFALGVSLYEKSQGRPPWGPAQLMALGKGTARPSLEFSDPGPPAGLQAVLEALLAMEPERRPGSVRDLERLQRGAAPGAERATPAERPRRPASGRTRPWGPLLLTLGLAAGGLTWWIMARPPPPSTRGKDVALREDLDRAIEELVGTHRDAAGEFGFARRDGAPGEHLMEVLDERLSPRYLDRLDAALRALELWLEAAPPAEADLHLRDVVLPALRHVRSDDLMLTWYRAISDAFGNAEAKALHRDASTMELVGTRLEQIYERLGSTARFLRTQGERDQVLYLVGTLAWGLERTEAHAEFLRMIERVEAAGDLPRRATEALAMSLLAPAATDHGPPFTCEDRRRMSSALAACARDLAASPGAVPPDLHARITATAAYRLYVDVVTCSEVLDDADVEELAALVELADQIGQSAPASVAVRLETVALYHQAAFLLKLPSSPRFEQVLARAQAVALDHDGRMRRVPREVGLGSTARGFSAGFLNGI